MKVTVARKKLRTGKPRRVRNWTQRAEPRPFLNCRFYAWLDLAFWAGLRWEGGLPTAVAITELLRKASGRPEITASGELQGSSAADLDRALSRVFPWMRTRYVMLSDAELLDSLGERFVAGVAVWLPKLPPAQQRYSGSSAIGHAVGLMGARKPVKTVNYIDPLGPNGYDGDWPRLKDIVPAFMERRYGKTFCTVLEVGDPMLTTVEVVRAFAGAGATGELPKGSIATFRVKPGANDFTRVKDVTLEKRSTVHVGYVAQVDKLPARGPKGRFYYVTDGPLAGRFIRNGETTLTPPTTDEGEYQQGFADGQADEAKRYLEVDETLYERTA